MNNMTDQYNHKKCLFYISYFHSFDEANVNTSVSTITSEDEDVNDNNFMGTNMNNSVAIADEEQHLQGSENSFLRVMCKKIISMVSEQKLDVLKKVFNWSLITLIMYQ